MEQKFLKPSTSKTQGVKEDSLVFVPKVREIPERAEVRKKARLAKDFQDLKPLLTQDPDSNVFFSKLYTSDKIQNFLEEACKEESVFKILSSIAYNYQNVNVEIIDSTQLPDVSRFSKRDLSKRSVLNFERGAHGAKAFGGRYYIYCNPNDSNALENITANLRWAKNSLSFLDKQHRASIEGDANRAKTLEDLLPLAGIPGSNLSYSKGTNPITMESVFRSAHQSDPEKTFNNLKALIYRENNASTTIVDANTRLRSERGFGFNGLNKEKRNIYINPTDLAKAAVSFLSNSDKMLEALQARTR